VDYNLSEIRSLSELNVDSLGALPLRIGSGGEGGPWTQREGPKMHDHLRDPQVRFQICATISDVSDG
jgi:hypothetical protein